MVLDFHGGEIKEKIEYDFSVNINPLGMPDYVRQTIWDSIDKISEYPDRTCSELRTYIADYEAVNPNQILCGNGASELIMAVCACMAHGNYQMDNNSGVINGIKALIQTPTFSGYERAANAFGGVVSYYNNVQELIGILNSDDKSVATKFKSSDDKSVAVMQKPKVIFICNPNNPTGEVVSRDELIKVLDMADKQDAFVVVDECFIDFTHEESLVDQTCFKDNLIVLKALTKFYALAGIRLGYLVSSAKTCEKISKFLPEWNVSLVAQLAGKAAFINKEKVANWKQETLKLIDTERDYLKDELTSLGIEVSDSKANFLLCRCATNDIYNKLKDDGILVRDCSNFNTLDNSYIRVCVSTHDKNEKLICAIRNLI